MEVWCLVLNENKACCEESLLDRTAKEAIGAENFLFLLAFVAFFAFVGTKMGAVNLINTLMNSAFDLLINTCFYIMAIAVIAGAIGALLSEFGVVALINKMLSPLMKPVYGLPGAASLGIMTTYLSDNPAILSLAGDRNYRMFFKKYQLPAMTNLGTAFGMGAIVTTFVMGIASPDGESFVAAALIGNVGAIIGSIVSTRLMLRKTVKVYGKSEWCDAGGTAEYTAKDYREIRPGNVGMRFINALLDGGKTGVTMGLEIVPGVVIICSLVLILTNGPSANGMYTGAAYEGVRFLPWLAELAAPVLKAVFGFSSSECIAVPVTALGSAGAAIGLIPQLVESGLATGSDVAVFTAMCMCWSGYLSTHVAMMDGLKCSQLVGKAIVCHTIGGLFAGFSAHWLYVLLSTVIG